MSACATAAASKAAEKSVANYFSSSYSEVISKLRQIFGLLVFVLRRTLECPFLDKFSSLVLRHFLYRSVMVIIGSFTAT